MPVAPTIVLHHGSPLFCAMLGTVYICVLDGLCNFYTVLYYNRVLRVPCYNRVSCNFFFYHVISKPCSQKVPRYRRIFCNSLTVLYWIIERYFVILLLYYIEIVFSEYRVISKQCSQSTVLYRDRVLRVPYYKRVLCIYVYFVTLDMYQSISLCNLSFIW